MLSRRNAGGHEERPIAEINITPLTDVFMVLLVIFMVAAPMMLQSSLKVHLPQVTSKEGGTQDGPLMVTMTRTGQLFVNDQSCKGLPEVEAHVTSGLSKDPSRLVIVNADRGILHGQVVELIDRIKHAGATQLGIGIEQKEK